MKIKLRDIAHGRSGDKGDAANIGIVAYDDNGYEIIKKYLTAKKNPTIQSECGVLSSFG